MGGICGELRARKGAEKAAAKTAGPRNRFLATRVDPTKRGRHLPRYDALFIGNDKAPDNNDIDTHEASHPVLPVCPSKGRAGWAPRCGVERTCCATGRNRGRVFGHFEVVNSASEVSPAQSADGGRTLRTRSV